MAVRAPLHIVTGKGGVGKTTVALALAHRLAADGARVAVAEVEGRGGLQLATGTRIGPEPTPLRSAVQPGRGRVLGVQIDAHRALAGYLQRYYRLGFAAEVLQFDPLVDFATRIAPGLRDILLIGQLTHLTDGHPDIDVVVLDAPPSGRIGSFLGAGEALTALTDGSPIAGQAASVMDDLRDPGCRVHVVTLLDELPVTEAIETVTAIRELGLTPGAVVANRCLDQLTVPDPPPTAPNSIDPATWAALTSQFTADAEAARAQTAWEALLSHRTELTVERLPELDPEIPSGQQPAALAPALGAL